MYARNTCRPASVDTAISLAQWRINAICNLPSSTSGSTAWVGSDLAQGPEWSVGLARRFARPGEGLIQAWCEFIPGALERETLTG